MDNEKKTYGEKMNRGKMGERSASGVGIMENCMANER